MASLSYPCYGLNVLNVNGETSPLPCCRLSNVLSFTPGAGTTMYYYEAADEFGMCVPNQGSSFAGTYSAVRTPVSGLYQIDSSYMVVGNTAAGNADSYICFSKSSNFGATGLFTTGSTTGAVWRRIATANGVIDTNANSITIWLEKDTYISLFVAGANSAVYSEVSSSFTVRCLSADNVNKTNWQQQ
jgi:hypothetical protein